MINFGHDRGRCSSMSIPAGFGELPGDPLAVGCAVTPSHEILRRPWLAALARQFGEALVEQLPNNGSSARTGCRSSCARRSRAARLSSATRS